MFLFFYLPVWRCWFPAAATRPRAAAAAGGSGAPSGKGGGGAEAAAAMSPSRSRTVGQKNVPVEVQVIGNVEAYSTISVKAQVTGPVDRTSISKKAISSRRTTCSSRSTRGRSRPR